MLPLRSEYIQLRGSQPAEMKGSLNLAQGDLLLFVYTGTQGARAIDQALEAVVKQLLEDYPSLHIAHVFGRLNETTMKSAYQYGSELEKRIHRLGFINNAHDYIGAADIIVARTGATSMAEFAMAGRCVITIPAPQLTGGHQVENAKLYQSAEAALVVDESDLPAQLDLAIRQALDQPGLRQKLAENIKQFADPHAARKLAKLILEETGADGSV